MKVSKYIALISLVFFFLSCSSSSNKKESVSEVKVEDNHEDESSTELTVDQIKSVGIEFGRFEMKNLSNVEKINGLLKVPNSSKALVTTVFGGVIGDVKIHEGDKVKKGQVIATISNPEFIDVQEQYLLVNNQITYAEQEVKRQQELFDNGAGARKNLQSASTQLKDLRTQRASLIKKLQMMGIDASTVNDGSIRNGLTIKAPISGTVSAMYAKVGSYVDVSSSVAEIINNEAVHLDLYVFERDISNIHIGQEINFSLTNVAGALYKAKVSSIGSSFENESKVILVHCTIYGDKSRLIDGMSVVASLSLSTSLEMAIPDEAIVDVDGKSYIFVKTTNTKNGSAHDHKEGDSHAHENESNDTIEVEKIEVVKGVSDLGYTSISAVKEIPKDALIVVKGAFFVNAKMSNSGGHEH